MKKLTFILILSLLLLTALCAVVSAETVVRGTEVTLVATLPEEVSAKSGAIELSFDTDVFTIVEGKWTFAAQPTIANFNSSKLQGVFMYSADVTLSGDVLLVKLNVKEDAPLESGSVTATIQLKGGAGVKTLTLTLSEYTVACNHSFTAETVSDQALATPATCTAPATYYYSCAHCAVVGDDATFAAGQTIPHVFDVNMAAEEYEKTPASCTEYAVYYYSCACGAAGTETFTGTTLLPHQYVNDCDVDCEVCNEVREITHAWGESFVAGGSTHYIECSVCHEKKDEAAHFYGSSCDSACDACGATRVTVHTWGNALVAGESTHYIECSVCHEKKDEVAHSFANACDTTCDACGKTREITHAWGESFVAGESTHYIECSVCHEKKDEAAHFYGSSCDSTCDACGATRVTTHTWGATLVAGENTHYIECSVCHEKKDEVAHSFANACDTACDTCGKTRESTHAWGESFVAGESTHYIECSVCHEKKDEVAHAFDSVCDTICDVCGATRVTDHMWGETLVVGENTHYTECSVCHEKKDEGEHNFDTGVVIQVPTQDAHGERKYTCDICGAIKTETLNLPVMLEQPNESWSSAIGGELTFRCDIPLADFISVIIDEKLLDPKYYTVHEGSMIVKVKESYLSTLAPGDHRLTIHSHVGDISANFITVIATNNDNSEGDTNGSHTSNQDDFDVNEILDYEIQFGSYSVSLMMVSIVVGAVIFALIIVFVIVKRKKY